MYVKGKTIVVTGGGNGMGRELVLKLLDKGSQVAAVDIDAAALLETSELAGKVRDRLATFVVDITEREAVEELPKRVIDRFGTVDGIINNAGIIQPFVRVNDLDYSLIERVMNINFYGTLYMTKAFLPHLLKRSEAHVVNISSMGGFIPFPGQSVYGASKAAVKLLTEGLRSELLETKVNVSVVFPGAIATNIAIHSGAMKEGAAQQSSEDSSMKPLPASEAAEIIVTGMEKGRARILVGSDAKFLDLFSRFFPEAAAGFIFKKMKSLLEDKA